MGDFGPTIWTRRRNSKWPRKCNKITPPAMITSWHMARNLFLRYWPFVRVIQMDSPQKGPLTRIWSFIWCWPKQTVQQTFEFSVIWDAMTLMGPRCNALECWYFITTTSLWPRWRLKSLASRLFTQSFIQAQIKENIKAPRHWPLCGEFTGTGEFHAQRASNAENVSIWWRHHVVFIYRHKGYDSPFSVGVGPSFEITGQWWSWE